MCGIHDMHCYCDDPLRHTILQILEQEPNIKFNAEDSKIIQKCLTTTEDPTAATDVIGEGDLDRLFAEDVFGVRKRWVRRFKRKLPKIRLSQWQPRTIKKLTSKRPIPPICGNL